MEDGQLGADFLAHPNVIMEDLQRRIIKHYI